MEALRDRIVAESAAAENECASANRALAAARAKDDDLRAEVKWRVAEKQAAERAAAEAESRHELASSALIQAERHSMAAAAAVAQKQALLGQLWDFEAQIQKQSQAVQDAKLEAQQAEAIAKERQREVEALLQEVKSLKATREHERLALQDLQQQNRMHLDSLKGYEELRLELQLCRTQLQALRMEKEDLETRLQSEALRAERQLYELQKTQEAEGEARESLKSAQIQLSEAKGLAARTATRTSAQIETLQEALKTAQNEAAALRARLESRPALGCEAQVGAQKEQSEDPQSHVCQPDSFASKEGSAAELLHRRSVEVRPIRSPNLGTNTSECVPPVQTPAPALLRQNADDMQDIEKEHEDFPETQVVQEPPAKQCVSAAELRWKAS
ncbi:CDPK-related kinase 6 [Durusdinium trenchii]|uniref:CDPK-related kinase 6 n=1 Tax=Durusdinium trenchii TaxID=1381693 RepID=A0ABP0MB22_9DINO